MLWYSKKENHQVKQIKGAMETIESRRDLSPEAKKRGMESLQKALERAKLKLVR